MLKKAHAHRTYQGGAVLVACAQGKAMRAEGGGGKGDLVPSIHECRANEYRTRPLYRHDTKSILVVFALRSKQCFDPRVALVLGTNLGTPIPLELQNLMYTRSRADFSALPTLRVLTVQHRRVRCSRCCPVHGHVHGYVCCHAHTLLAASAKFAAPRLSPV